MQRNKTNIITAYVLPLLSYPWNVTEFYNISNRQTFQKIPQLKAGQGIKILQKKRKEILVI